MFAVCVYCASGVDDPAAIGLAERVGEQIGRRGWRLVSGGGRVSMMGAVARAARAAGGHTVGVIPRMLMRREVADVDAHELIVTETMRERKQIMDERADAFLTLPGGVGTLEELFETWTAGYLGAHEKPVVLLDPDRHYSPLLEWLGTLTEHGYVSQAALDRLTVVADTDDAFTVLERAEAKGR
jgi:uncharacterized protein (TIGR00730 family)